MRLPLFVLLVAGAGALAAADLDLAVRTVRGFNSRALRLAITDLKETFGDKYPRGDEFLRRLATLENSRDAEVTARAAEINRLRCEALLANPLLDFDRLLVVKRVDEDSPRARKRQAISPLYRDYGPGLALPVNHYSSFSVEPAGHDNEIAVLSPVRPAGQLTTLFRPRDKEFVGDIDLHWDADRLLFTMPSQGRYQVFEIRADGSGLRQVTPGDQPDVDNYDGAYLPGGKIVFCSTANYQSIPCWNGLHNIAGLYTVNADGEGMRQLTFDQDDDSYPTVLNTGQILYNRWEYANTPHIFVHMLFQMNPDGTGQRGFYGSNSYWPNALYFARAIPGHASKVVAIVSGHHGDSRMGELVVLDPAKGRHETDGVVQRIPGYGGKVEPVIKDFLVSGSWPKFLSPHPLSDKYFLVAAKTSPEANWGVYLVDVFDNMLLLYEREGYALLDPTPLRRTPRPPAIPEKVDYGRKDAIVYLHDVYVGPGLAGVPRGLVKKLRVYAYHFGYRGVTGWDKVGIDGPWDVMRILGSVPVDPDGSAMFRVPASMPLAVQPLDAGGRALQVMRSWLTAMPGEVRSCIGCHEDPNSAPPVTRRTAATRAPSEIEPWYGPPRGFDFEREVQPVLDRHCAGCHNGRTGIPDLRSLSHFPNYAGGLANVPAWWSDRNPVNWVPELMRRKERKTTPIKFTPAYEALHPYVRRPGLESDYHLPFAAEYHASTSELIQMLEKGHHGVRLDREAWDRLVTWIDLNAPCHGTWGQILPVPFDGVRRRRELLRLYAGADDDPEALPAAPHAQVQPIVPPPLKTALQPVSLPGWPFDIQEARERQRAASLPHERTVHGVKLALIPAGEFVMGDTAEPPLRAVRIDKPFWAGVFEVTNEQYREFDPAHDSGYINFLNTNVTDRGYPVNEPRQPVVRVSWDQAMAFCRWLSERTGESFTLPTEQQWEYACRAGTATPLYYGETQTNFAPWANMADASLKKFADDARARGVLWRIQPDWMLRVATVNDGAQVSAAVGGYLPNAWGLHDMHGNAGEWTRSAGSENGGKVVRGGSWYDRPKRCRSAFRLQYPSWQRVYNVGFRVIAEAK